MAYNTFHASLADGQWLLGRCIVILMPPYALMSALRGPTGRWPSHLDQARYRVMVRSQVDYTLADGPKTLCMDPLWMDGHFCNG